MSTRGRSAALATASARCPVPWDRLSRMRRFLASVQRPTMVSPDRWMTASKPETVSGGTGRAGSQITWSLPAAEFRTSRVTANPLALRKGSRADPIGPEAPLTRMREEFMLDRFVSTLADCVARAPSPAAVDIDGQTSTSKGRGRGARATQPRYNQAWRPSASRSRPTSHGHPFP